MPTQAPGEGAILWEPYHEHPGLWPIAFRLRALPGQQFVVYFPECFTARESVNFWQHQTAWTFGSDSARAVAASPSYAHEVAFRYREAPGLLTLEWECTFENRMGEAFHDLAAFNCFFLSNAPLFKDVEMTRTWVLDEAGREVRLDSIPKTRAPRTLQFYPTGGGADLPACPWLASLQAISARRLSGDRIWVTSTDGRWRLETAVHGPVAYFFNNWESDHGCIHAAPLFGTVAPGERASVRGSIRFIELPGKTVSETR